MMRYMKKSIALILSLLIMLSILQGCSVQKNEQVESKESETTAETTIADLKNNHTDSVPEFEGEFIQSYRLFSRKIPEYFKFRR